MADSTKLNNDGLNKVWLKVMELIQSLTGNVDRTKGTLQEQINVKATSKDYGRVKVTNSSAVTDSTGLALAATEKNASIDGTLAKRIDELNANLESKADKTMLSNPNLLDNPWFTVNQRGQSEYEKTNTGSGGIYSVDRWKVFHYPGKVKITDNGLEIVTIDSSSSSFAQSVCDSSDYLNKFAGRTVTFSAIINNELVSCTGVCPSTIDSTVLAIANAYSSNDICGIQLRQQNKCLSAQIICKQDHPNGYKFTVKAVKLELGSVSTLANDVAPNYQQELAKCQRYCYVMDWGMEHNSHGYGIVDMSNGTRARLFIPIPVKMRTNTPTLSSTDLANWYIIGSASGDLINSGKITKIELWYASDSELAFTLTGTGLTYHEFIIGHYNTADKLIISADL